MEQILSQFTQLIISSFTDFKIPDFIDSFEEHDSKRLSKAISLEGEADQQVRTVLSTDFAGLRKSVTANFSLLMNKANSQDLLDPIFNEPSNDLNEEILGKRDALENLTPQKSAKKSKGKSSAKGKNVKSKSGKSPRKGQEEDQVEELAAKERELRKQFSFGDLSLAFQSAQEGPLNKSPSMADLGFAVKLEGTLENEGRGSEKDRMNLRSHTSPKLGS